MNGTVQHCTTFRATSGSKIWGGDKPAKIYIGVGSGTEDTSYMYGTMDGCVSFEQATANIFTMHSKSKSTGDLIVSNGRLSIAASGSWLDGTNIVARGTGRFILNARGQLNKNIAHVQISDDGIVEIAEGVSQIVKKLSVNGVELPPGIYGGEEASGVTDASYAKHFAGKGTLRVYAGMTVVVR
jgi:hypothetical protein